MRITLTVFLAGVLVPPFAWGQKLELKFDHLKAKAAESAEVDLDGSALELALKSGLQNLVKPAKELNTEQIKQALVGLKGVYVRNFEFAKPGEYTDADVESVLQQVRDDSAWARLIRVKEKEERVEIYLMSKGDQVGGLLVLVAEPKELTVVNIVGSIALDQLKELVSSTLHYDLKNLPGKQTTP
ncbi:MAG: DUF4252 domain-containing protein [Bryobacteraceae bacterium]|jgi:hypothetical protein